MLLANMTSRPPRTNTTFFLVAIVLLTGGLLLATKPKPGSSGQTADTASSPNTPNSSTQTVPDTISWNGELVLLRNSTIVARSQSAKERTIYTAPSGTTIVQTTPMTGTTVAIELSSGSPKIILVDVSTGKVTPRNDINSLTATAPRPTTNGYASVSFSNAERDFGSHVVLNDNGLQKNLYQTNDAVTLLMWRADGSQLAIGTQTGVAIADITAGTSKEYALGSPAKSLRWFSGALYVVTADGTVTVVDGTATPSTTVVPKGIGMVARDFVPLGNNRFAWLGAAGLESPISITTQDLALYDTNHAAVTQESSANELLGVTNGN